MKYDVHSQSELEVANSLLGIRRSISIEKYVKHRLARLYRKRRQWNVSFQKLYVHVLMIFKVAMITQDKMESYFDTFEQEYYDDLCDKLSKSYTIKHDVLAESHQEGPGCYLVRRSDGKYMIAKKLVDSETKIESWFIVRMISQN